MVDCFTKGIRKTIQFLWPSKTLVEFLKSSKTLSQILLVNYINCAKAGCFKSKNITASRGFSPPGCPSGFCLSIQHPQTINRIRHSHAFGLYPLFIILMMFDTQIFISTYAYLKITTRHIYMSALFLSVYTEFTINLILNVVFE